MFKSTRKASTPPRLSGSFLSPVCRRKMKRYKEAVSSTFSSLSSECSFSNRSCRNLDSKTSESQTENKKKTPTWAKRWWSTPNLGKSNEETQTRYLGGRRESSEWTKIRHTLEFIRKSKEMLKDKKRYGKEEDRKTQSLIFLGQVYQESFGDAKI